MSDNDSDTQTQDVEVHPRPVRTLADLDAAASALSSAFRAERIPHAFCGGYWAVKLGRDLGRATEDVDCIVGSSFKPCIDALNKAGNFEVPNRIASGAKRVFYILPGPTNPGTEGTNSTSDHNVHHPNRVKIELLRSGEFGPVKITSKNTIEVPPGSGIPFLTPTEFVRAKVKAWIARRAHRDANDVLHVMTIYGQSLDVDRVNPQGGLDDMASEIELVKEVWDKLKDSAEEDEE